MRKVRARCDDLFRGGTAIESQAKSKSERCDVCFGVGRRLRNKRKERCIRVNVQRTGKHSKIREKGELQLMSKEEMII
jgi:hypothetical protein